MGLKRQCGNCGTKFFDFGRDKIVCPKCGTPFVAVAMPTRAPARAAPARVPDEEKDDESGADVISLEEADAGDDAAATVPGVDGDEEDEEPAGDTFLEEEEEDGDDVAALIDSDIETDEEP